MSKIVVVLTAADTLPLADGTGHRTGFWAEEFVVAHRTLVSAGHDVSIATPGGKPAPVDPGSVNPAVVGEKAADEFATYLESVAGELANPRDLASISASDVDAIVFPGGHGPMVDLAVDPALGALLNAADAAGTIIAPFCHGPAALLSARRADGSFTFSGRRMTSFTDAEEQAGGVAGMQWLLASRLREEGAILEAGPAFSSFVVTDGNLITGQNPQSSQEVSDAVLAALRG
ncbi:type 1 glutamine amidotransferase domain-containing protein [Changpingibacter yushuensis]|uniref:type 1 glutamine amidotransferase domain-containing protein n=1 Tax=Changpingibacter yushuensis TaxID=2758440 RepID=UPI00165D762B|nr:type 1 glutamine amidotransferase domain-containing protein [Changpingibacter yushuensis]